MAPRDSQNLCPKYYRYPSEMRIWKEEFNHSPGQLENYQNLNDFMFFKLTNLLYCDT